MLRWVMQEIQKSTSLELQVIAAGMYLSTGFGLTYREIEADSFRIDRKVEMQLSANTPLASASQIELDWRNPFGRSGIGSHLDEAFVNSRLQFPPYARFLFSN